MVCEFPAVVGVFNAAGVPVEGAEDVAGATFRDSYTSLTKDLVIPGAKQKQISAAASVPAGDAGQDRRPLVDLRPPTGVMMSTREPVR